MSICIFIFLYLDFRSVDLEQKRDEETALLRAAACNNARVVELLIDCGADITTTDDGRKYNIFHTVACKGATDALKVKMLIELAIALPKALLYLKGIATI